MSDIDEPNIVDQWNLEDETPDTSQAGSPIDPSTKYASTQLRVVRSSLDLALNTLKGTKGKNDYINLSPSFQRRGRWDRKKKSLLIESFLLNIPVPPIFLYENKYNEYEVMDGRQRLEAIQDFLDNVFSLSGLEYWGELNGLRFNELPDTIQRGLLRRTLNAIVLLAETDKIEDVDIRLLLFDRLNTGGVQLNPQELRNAIYPSEFGEMLKTVSRSREFTDLWKIPAKTAEEPRIVSKRLEKNLLYKSMMDCELVLRFFAIKEAMAETFRGSLRSILDKTARLYQSRSSTDCDRLKDRFVNILRTLEDSHGNADYLRLPGTNKNSRPLYDALTVACQFVVDNGLLSRMPGWNIRLQSALYQPEKYEILVGRGNTLHAIKNRVRLAYEILCQEILP